MIVWLGVIIMYRNDHMINIYKNKAYALKKTLELSILLQLSSIPQLQPHSLSHQVDWLWQGWSWAALWLSGGIWRLCWGSSRSYHLRHGHLEPDREKKIHLLSEYNSNYRTLFSTLNIWVLSLKRHYDSGHVMSWRGVICCSNLLLAQAEGAGCLAY